jgi:hypothetical protein
MLRTRHRFSGAGVDVFAGDVDRGLITTQHRLGGQRVLEFPSKPAPARHCASRSCARATNPQETGLPSSAAISIAARSTGTLPSLDNKTAAAFTFGP